VWCYVSAKLKKDLAYQAEENFMMHESAVLSLAFSGDSELLASGDQDGMIKIWEIKTGSHLNFQSHS
jgi:WD40 repeat-containing protein SMU1